MPTLSVLRCATRVCVCLSVGKLPQRSSLWALSLSLSAVNLSESAQAAMAPAQLTQIYVTAAIALRTVLGHHLSFLPVGSRTQNNLIYDLVQLC